MFCWQEGGDDEDEEDDDDEPAEKGKKVSTKKLHHLLPPYFIFDLFFSICLLKKGEGKSFKEKMQAITNICSTVQNALDEVASNGERLKK